MKHMRKLSSLLLALVLALAVAVPAFAAEEPTRFVKPGTGTATKYELFKVMDAELVDGALQNFSWPTGTGAHFFKDRFIDGMKNLTVSDDKNETEVKAVAAAKDLFSGMTGTTSDEEVAKALDKLRNDYPAVAGDLVARVLTSAGVRTTAPAWEIDTPLDGKPGYYMVLATFADGSTRSSLYNVKGNEGPIVINEKSSELPPTTPEAFKKVQDASGNWVDATDYPEGKVFQFQLSTPIKGYSAGSGKTHEIILHDQMDGALLKVPGEGDIKAVYIIHKNEDGTEVRADITHYTFSTGALASCATKGTTCAFHVSFDAAEAQFPAASGITGIQNGDMVYVEYESQLLPGADVGTAGNKNGVWAETPTGPSEITEVTVYTFTLVADKKDGGNQQPLPGATFQLSKLNNGIWEPVGEKIGTPVHVDADGKPIDDQGNPVAEGGQLWYESKNEAGETVLTTEGQTHFDFSKLGEGRYELKEVDYPMTSDGKKYNEAGPYYFEVKAEYNKDTAGNNVSLKSITVTVQDKDGNTLTQDKPIDLGVAADQGTISTEIMNNTGFQMPSTGGIGTTIFYIVGGILAAGAVILLITKRRMRVEEE